MDTQPRTSGGDDLASVVLLWLGLPAAALATAWGGLCWLAGHASSILTGHGTLAGSGDPWSLGARVVTNLDDLQQAWPDSARADLGPVSLLVTLLAIFGAVLIGTVGLCVRWWLLRTSSGRADSGARWATRAEEKEMCVPDDPRVRPGRLVAGRAVQTRRLLAADDCISAIGFGPNGSGKTTGLIAPNVLASGPSRFGRQPSDTDEPWSRSVNWSDRRLWRWPEQSSAAESANPSSSS